MFGLGTFGSFAGKRASRKVMTAGAVMVAVLGLCMLSQSWNLFGLAGISGMPLANVPTQNAASSDSAKFGINKGHLLVNSTLLPFTYPSITVEAGRPVRWVINAPPENINGCNNRIFIREYGIEYTFKPGENVIEFIPGRAGKVPYTCWMGMIPGTITVVSGSADENRTQQQPSSNQSAPKKGGACCAAKAKQSTSVQPAQNGGGAACCAKP